MSPRQQPDLEVAQPGYDCHRGGHHSAGTSFATPTREARGQAWLDLVIRQLTKGGLAQGLDLAPPVRPTHSELPILCSVKCYELRKRQSSSTEVQGSSRSVSMAGLASGP